FSFFFLTLTPTPAFSTLSLHDALPIFLAILGDLFNGRFGAHGEAAAPALVRRFDAFAAGNIAAGWEVRPGHELHHFLEGRFRLLDRKSTRLNSSHLGISYAVFCLKKKK